VEAEYGIPVFSVIDLNDIIDFLTEQSDDSTILASMKDYRANYGIDA
jgi:orotate phosphoribosyltransferase